MIGNDVISQIAGEEGVDPDVVRAIIQIESSGNPFAWRTEAAYRYLWDVKSDSPFRPLRPVELNSEVAPNDFHTKVGSRNTEWLGQQASWGPMQVMGAVARELDFQGHFPELCGAEGIRIGCRLLKKLVAKYKSALGYEGVAAAYNAGTPRLEGTKYKNQEYVDKFNAAYRKG